jgi:uncharacterized tellurite resistance protein B-like protein
VNQELRTTICRLIAGLVVADDDLGPEEEAFLDRVLAKFDIPPSERDSIFPIVDRTEAAEAIRLLPQHAQEVAFGLLLEATVADGVVAPEERVYVETVGKELGVSGSELERRLQSALAAKS